MSLFDRLRDSFTGPTFSFQWVVISAGVLATLGYALVGVVDTGTVERLNTSLTPSVGLLAAFGLEIRQPPLVGSLPEQSYRVVTAIQLWTILAYDLALLVRIAWTRRPLSEPREVVISRLMAGKGLSRRAAQVMFHALYLLLILMGLGSTWCLLNGPNGLALFHVDSYAVLPIPVLIFVLPGVLALPLWLGLAENLLRDLALVYRSISQWLVGGPNVW